MRKIVQCSILALGLLSLAGCKTPENPFQTMALPDIAEAETAPPSRLPPQLWRPVDRATGQITNIEELQDLAEDFPNSSSVRLRLLNALLGAEQSDTGLAVAEQLVSEGYQFSDGALAYLAGLTGDDARPAWLSNTADPDGVVAVSTLIAEIPANIRLPEAALHDPAYSRLFVTSIVSRGLFVRQQDAAGDEDWQQVAIEDAGSLAGLAVDERYGLIWVASGVVDQTPEPQTAFRGVVALDRATLREVRRVALPQDATVSDIAVGPDGTVFASDPVGGGVWMASRSDTQMQPLLAPGTFRSPQGLAVAANGRAIYISDYRYGLAAITLPSRQVYRMQSAEPILLDGVDGLWLHGSELIVMQNGINPHRLVALQLGSSIASITGHRIIERANPAWTEPLGGFVLGGRLTYVGTGQWDIYGDGGAINEGAEPRIGEVRGVSLMPFPSGSAE